MVEGIDWVFRLECGFYVTKKGGKKEKIDLKATF
jgi:hypothetical protein